MDSAWEQEKLEARKILENAAESHTSGAPLHEGKPSFFQYERFYVLRTLCWAARKESQPPFSRL
ncbi:MAG: hypothetical protein P8Y72_13075 [Anaerolineales bacterium]|jgi:hypothetical protein